jgi:hypothetical protein
MAYKTANAVFRLLDDPIAKIRMTISVCGWSFTLRDSLRPALVRIATERFIDDRE